MSNYEALKCATVNGAELLGMESELGTLEEGKLADLIVLEKSPLDDIMNTENVIYTMVNGRLYDTETMNELGDEEKARTKFFWELEGSGNAYPFYESTHSFMRPKCGCGL